MEAPELAELIRAVATAVDSSGLATIQAAVRPLRDAGIVPNCHVGRGEEMRTNYLLQLEWYAGQILEIVDKDKLFAVNAWLNCVEKFTTPGAE